jgi:hypothetical protein
VRKGDAELDDLLARGRLSAPQRERIWARLSWSAPVRGGVRGWRLRLGIAIPVAGVAVAVLAIRLGSDRRDPFVAKGGGGSRIAIECDHGALTACPAGSKLIFRDARAGQPAYLEAYADPVGHAGERVWYFPARDRTAPRLDAGEGALLRDAVVVGPEHPPGDYAIHALVSTRPLDRAEAAAREPAAVVERTVIPLRVVPR